MENKNNINYQKAKKRNNKYSLYINCKEIITDATYSSALQIFNSLLEDKKNDIVKKEISIAKVYDRKDKDKKERFGFKVIKSNKKERIGEFI